MKPAQHALAFTDWETQAPLGPGCRKVRRGDVSGGGADGAPSPPSGSRQLTRGIAPGGGTPCAGPATKGATVLDAERGAAMAGRRRRHTAGRAHPREAARAVDTETPSDIVQRAKSLYKSRGLAVSYQSSRACYRVAVSRSLESVEAPRRALGPASPAPVRSRLAQHLSSVVSEGGELHEMPERGSRVRASSPGGMGLAGSAGTGTLPRGSGSQGGRRRHERIRFGIRATGLRARRDAAHLLHGCVRARRRRCGA